MDVSDGLAGDLAKLARASGIGAEIAVDKVPLSLAARTALAAEPALRETILTGGDDFEIIAAVNPSEIGRFRAQAEAKGVAVTEIGSFGGATGAPRFSTADGEELTFDSPSYSHF